MITYWSSERRFVDSHNLAIRFVEPPSELRQKALRIPVDNKIKQEWCDRCSCWHLILEASPRVITSGIAKVGVEDVASK